MIYVGGLMSGIRYNLSLAKEGRDFLQRKGEHRMNVEIVKNENMEERLAAYAEKTAK